MNGIALLLKAFVLSHTLELGVIPGNDLSLYRVPSVRIKDLDVGTTYYAAYATQLTIAKIVYFDGGVTSFCFRLDPANGYPIRMDYKIGGGLMYKWISAGIKYTCYHPILPNDDVSPLPRLDAYQARIFARGEMEEIKLPPAAQKIFSFSPALEAGVIPGAELTLYRELFHQKGLSVSRCYYGEVSAKLTAVQIIYLNGGISLYCPMENAVQPDGQGEAKSTVDFEIGGGLRYKWISLGVDYGRYDQIAPSPYCTDPLPRINAYQFRCFIRGEISSSPK